MSVKDRRLKREQQARAVRAADLAIKLVQFVIDNPHDNQRALVCQNVAAQIEVFAGDCELLAVKGFAARLAEKSK